MAENPPKMDSQFRDAEELALGTRMKDYEKQYQKYLDPKLPFMVRLDGRSFSKLTQGLHKPFDEKFASVMTAVACDLLEEFKPRTVYTQSDEISLLFYLSDNPDSQHIFGGRVDKIVSVMAAYATARLIIHLLKEDWSGYSPNVQQKMTSGHVSFDGRAFSLDETEMCNCIVWRCRHDCVRNITSNYATCKFGHKAVHGWDGNKMREELKKAGIDWDTDVPAASLGSAIAVPLRAKYGVFVKKAQVPVTVTVPSGPSAGKTLDVMRSKIVTRSFLLDRASPENVELMKAKYAAW